MGIRVEMENLYNKADSVYRVVLMATQRARQLSSGAKPLVKCRSDKPTTIALNEIVAGKVKRIDAESIEEL